jgi:hypothetical protein
MHVSGDLRRELVALPDPGQASSQHDRQGQVGVAGGVGGAVFHTNRRRLALLH